MLQLLHLRKLVNYKTQTSMKPMNQKIHDQSITHVKVSADLNKWTNYAIIFVRTKFTFHEIYSTIHQNSLQKLFLIE